MWEFFFTKKYHHVVGNHVIGIHVKWGTAVHTNTIYILNEYVLVNIMFSFVQTLLQIDRKAREVFCSK